MVRNGLKGFAVGSVLVLALAACGGGGAGSSSNSGAGGGESASPSDQTIGVAMPTQTSERWIADGNAVKSQLEAKGYKVDLQYAADDIPTQQQQLDQMIINGDDALIVASIDGTALSSQLAAAADKKIPVIAYDRLINGTKDVDFYVTFDNENVGVQQATSLLVGLGILKADGSKGTATGPFNIELFAGSLDDNNTQFFFKGAMKTLQPYLDSGVLVVKSGQTSMEQAATLRWQQEVAQKRMEDLLTSAYSDGTKVQGVLSPYDGLSRGILTALTNAGYAPGDVVITGQDAEIASVKLINDGGQFATIFKDTRTLATQAVDSSVAFLTGATPESNDTTTYDNGVKVVPSFLLQSDIVYKDTIKPLLIDSGYYTQAEVDSGQAG